jgi:hypothetical protein
MEWFHRGIAHILSVHDSYGFIYATAVGYAMRRARCLLPAACGGGGGHNPQTHIKTSRMHPDPGVRRTASEDIRPL